MNKLRFTEHLLVQMLQPASAENCSFCKEIQNIIYEKRQCSQLLKKLEPYKFIEFD